MRQVTVQEELLDEEEEEQDVDMEDYQDIEDNIVHIRKVHISTVTGSSTDNSSLSLAQAQ